MRSLFDTIGSSVVLRAIGLCAVGVVLMLSVGRVFLPVTSWSFPAPVSQRMNLLLLGVGGEGHDGGGLTDTIILASIDTGRRDAVLLSIPRDVILPDSTVGRINAFVVTETQRILQQNVTSDMATAQRQALQAFATRLSGLLGVSIDGVISVDFDTLVQTVDAVGGIDIVVPERIVDVHYPVREGRVGTFVIEKGPQHIDGETALRYARSRYSTSDFDRSLRQQQIITALAERIRVLDAGQLLSFAQSLYAHVAPNVHTTFEPAELVALARVASTLSLDRVHSYNLHVFAGGDTSEAQVGGLLYPPPAELFGGASVLLPLSFGLQDHGWRSIALFARMLVEERAAYTTAPVQIVYAPTVELQAWRLRNELLRYGWNVMPSQALSTVPDSSVVQIADETDEEIAQIASKLVALPISRTEHMSGSASLVLRLSPAYRFSPFAAQEDDPDSVPE